jgi:hypothetical protein
MIATMIVLVIIAILAVVFLRGSFMGGNTQSPRKDKLGNSTIGLVKYAAKDEVCRNNIDQLRGSITIFHNSNGDEGYPATIEDTKLGLQFYTCPVGGEKYVYDPTTGKVHCPHPGHENY